MSKFLLLHDNDSEGKPAIVRKDFISSVLPSEEYDTGSTIFSQNRNGGFVTLEAKESVEEIYNMLND